MKTHTQIFRFVPRQSVHHAPHRSPQLADSRSWCFRRGDFSVGDPNLEYKGEIISAKEAQRRYERSTAEDGHTFFFGLDDGRMIDGAQGGSSARRKRGS
ncbi:hypothetical protein [Caballeronia sp. LZ035]|uniref:hypothetical protein n=1 Tax=Caballeronia sp. LZ035 TaxID=3038568 RepID=UPI0028561880|nr:hypothetical protein [Caballeronia sp. LZ035]MDR5761479.1 hypothetical protein [Caballeronia sp. LZ035]